MVKLEFEQVLEYVKDGEKDPHIGGMLRTDPDGPAMLREARLMYDVLGQQPDVTGGDEPPVEVNMVGTGCKKKKLASIGRDGSMLANFFFLQPVPTMLQEKEVGKHRP